ncbi:MAG: T9SS type A sorting domain-containing protein [Bacteroidota bacterium]
MKHFQPIGIIAFFCCLAQMSIGQVKFKLTQLADGKTYQVSLISEETYDNPMNVTSTAQVTIKAPTKGFEVDQIFNLQEGVVWEPNSLTEAPDEAPEFDYISFGLVSQGTGKIFYQAGVEIPLFAFTNFLTCQGEISLIDNLTDPFSPPNSRTVNVGNQITILGAKGDAYIGNMSEDAVLCEGNLTDIEIIEKAALQLNLFPNPTADFVTVQFNWTRANTSANVAVFNMNGDIVRKEGTAILNGQNDVNLDISGLAAGNYFVEIYGEDWKITSDSFVKMTN